MREVMVRAWEIAREGQRKFGGKVKEYFAIALKLAWKEVKEGAMEKVQYGYKKIKRSDYHVLVRRSHTR